MRRETEKQDAPEQNAKFCERACLLFASPKLFTGRILNKCDCYGRRFCKCGAYKLGAGCWLCPGRERHRHVVNGLERIGGREETWSDILLFGSPVRCCICTGGIYAAVSIELVNPAAVFFGCPADSVFCLAEGWKWKRNIMPYCSAQRLCSVRL